MDVGDRIRQLRKGLGVTQETLGEYLGISAQAVSRWESGACCPDIELLPLLAEFFDVTTDELLGMDRSRTLQIIRDCLTETEKLFELGEYKKIVVLVRKHLEKYPNSTELRLVLADALVSDVDGDGVNEACEICRHIIKNSRNTEQQKGEARRILCIAYTFRLKDEDKTQSVIDDMADWNYCRELFTAKYLTGSPAHSQMKDNLKWLVDNVWSIMMNFCSLDDTYVANQYTAAEKIVIACKCIDLLQLIFDDNYMYYCTRVCASYMLLARLYIMNGDLKKAPSCIEKASFYAAEYDGRPDEDKYHCILLKGVPYVKHQWRENREHTESYYILKQLREDIFDGVRDDKIMKELERTVQKYETNIL